MAVTTPTGLTIRFPAEYTFALLARLWAKDPRTDARRVLRTCEGIDSIPGMLGFLFGLIAGLSANVSVWWILVGGIGGRLIGYAITSLGLFIIPGLVSLGMLWCYLPVLAISQIAAAVVVGMSRGWGAAGIWITAVLAGVVLELLLDAVYARRTYRLTGLVLWSSDRSFINAYRLHADRLGVTRDLEVGVDEVLSSAWSDCLADYTSKCPSTAV